MLGASQIFYSVASKSSLSEAKIVLHGCPEKECPLNTKDAENHPLVLYSNALFCVMRHTSVRIPVRSFPLICDFESSVIEDFYNHMYPGVKQNPTDLSCEQDMESLSFKLFEAFILIDSSVLRDTPAVSSLLSLLLLRKEYERFFHVFGMNVKKSVPVFKLALLASLCLKERDPLVVLDAFRKFLGIAEEVSDTPSGEATKWAQDVEEDSFDVDPADLSAAERVQVFCEIRSWFSKRYKTHRWNVSLENWKNSKDIEGSSEAMIDLCMKFKEYEEGWRIYKESISGRLHALSSFRLSSRALRLAIRAVNAYGTQIWTERVLELSTIISRLSLDSTLKIKSTFSVLLEIERYTHLSYIAGLVIKQYPAEAITSKSVGVILEDAVRVVERHAEEVEIDTQAGKLPEIAKFSLSLYSFWKKKSARGMLATLFFGRSADTVDAYGSALRLCTALKNKQQMAKVCQDVWEDGIPVSHSIFSSLSEIHLMLCKCTCFGEEDSETRKYLTHVLSLLSEERAPEAAGGE